VVRRWGRPGSLYGVPGAGPQGGFVGWAKARCWFIRVGKIAFAPCPCGDGIAAILPTLRMLAVFYSITSSAATRSLSGTARPRAFAVFRLMRSSNLVGNRTGRSVGFAPFKMRPA
jgi:hypothetical protein